MGSFQEPINYYIIYSIYLQVVQLLTHTTANMSDSEIQILLDDSDFQETCQMGKELIKAVQGLLGTRKLTLSLLHTLKKDVEESYDRSRNARIGGTAATVTGSGQQLKMHCNILL